jgi:arylsulfatase A-like enzyme
MDAEGRVEAVEWSFDAAQPDWKPIRPLRQSRNPVTISRIEDALRVSLTESTGGHGGIYIDLPDWPSREWAYISIQARAIGEVEHIEVGFNLREEIDPDTGAADPLIWDGAQSFLIQDGDPHTYLLRSDWNWWGQEGLWKQLGVEIGGEAGSSVEILKIGILPKGDEFSGENFGMRVVSRESEQRRAIFCRLPARIEYQVEVPDNAHFHFGMGVVDDDAPITFRVAATVSGGEPTILFEESYNDGERWADRHVNLDRFAGSEITLTLEAESELETELESEFGGSVALWSVPTLSSLDPPDRPNIILYVLDAGGADFMSAYDYNRRTTPNLERLAAEGAVFERAFSNATWTKPSTTSFMTSLHHSVLGGYANDADPLPEQAVSMAEHLHRAEYQTAVFTANPYAGRISGLDRGVDVMHDAGIENNTESSNQLQSDFWRWREAFPAQPFWVHIQTTDVHMPYHPPQPFAGTFVSPNDRETYHEWEGQLREAGSHNPYSDVYEQNGIDRPVLSEMHRGLYDESMAHNDYQIGRLVEGLKRSGEWENTLLIVAADHGYVAASYRVMDPLPPKWAYGAEGSIPFFNSHLTSVPMIFIWPGHIAPGQRFSEPVSMIDLLPTVLDLAGLAPAEVAQGQSLAPLLIGEGEWQSRPVVLDEFTVDPTSGELRGVLELVDGRWGASLEINPEVVDEEIADDMRRPSPLLLYDLWNDPFTLHSLHAEYPDLVEKYTRLIQIQWQESRELGKRFTRSSEAPLTSEQLETLRALGYIQ